MTDPSVAKKLPGNSGLPLLGETLTFLKDGFGFVARGVAAHGPVFRTNILGRDTVIMTGPEACARWMDPALVERHGAMPPHVKELFGGESLPSLDGQAHKNRKLLVLAGFTRDALESCVPGLEATIDSYLERWAGAGELTLVPEVKRLAIEAICTSVLGMSRGPVLEQLLADYMLIGPGLGSLPIPVPGTAFSKARKALARIFAVYDGIIKEHRAAAAPQHDGLSRMLAAKAPDGTELSDDDAMRELHHIVMAGVIIWAEFAGTLMLLDTHPDVRKKVVEEIQREAPSGPLTLAKLRAFPYLAQVVMEVKRSSPVVPVQFGKAKAAFELNGYEVPQGWMIMWGVHGSNQFDGVFTQPGTFDPDRFAAGRAEHEKHAHAFVPQGPGPAEGHRCPGLDFATTFMSLFMVHVLRKYTWTLPKQELALRWNMIPPEPASGLRVHFSG